MAYHPLTSDSGSDAKSRVEEAQRILRLLEENDCFPQLSEKELKFTREKSLELAGSFALLSAKVSVKELFWLRDIWARFQ